MSATSCFIEKARDEKQMMGQEQDNYAIIASFSETYLTPANRKHPHQSLQLPKLKNSGARIIVIPSQLGLDTFVNRKFLEISIIVQSLPMTSKRQSHKFPIEGPQESSIFTPSESNDLLLPTQALGDSYSSIIMDPSLIPPYLII